jgi:hypothetical protein
MSDISSTLLPIPTLLAEVQARLDQIGARVAEVLGEDSVTPTLSARDLVRLERVGEVAYRHWQFREENGSITLGESLAIRRALYGDKVQSTANLFGRSDSGALFYREVEYGSPRSDSQEVHLTEEGERIARLWRDVHPEPQ